ncbi:TetR/AcrR family transcriptional regulator [Pseudomonas cyclaminis]|uniref:TetR/AcrR family transcriptional regulator n=1 Tax=Pseudomonas cyclaminis TaxID=2781239 RepID=UPI002095A916|nr:TetR/AcrR family transcriptional regulator [Pseudomonas cyclaminis]
MQAIEVAEKTDHRLKTAEKKRLVMRMKLLDAAMRVFAENPRAAPVIDDVIREAKVSRGTFYRYFDTLDQVLIALGQELNNQMTADILPIYEVLPLPWQRLVVGFRVYLLRAVLDRKWAGFVSRADTWSHHAIVATGMTQDMESGKQSGVFVYGRADATTDFLMGASALGIRTLMLGVEKPHEYTDTLVRMAISSVGYDRDQVEYAVHSQPPICNAGWQASLE